MPWSEVTVQENREEFVRLARQADANVSELCRRYGISRKTGYKWLARDDFDDRSRRPHASPSRTSARVEDKVVALRAKHPAWGGRKIAHVLMRDEGLQLAPSTANSVLRRHGLISPSASQASVPWQRFEHAWPNSLWQIDFKGHFATDAGRCHPLTVLDDHSRFNIVLRALGTETTEPVRHALQAAFERYGLPERINGDNGAPWGNPSEGAVTKLGVWLIRLGVRLSHSRPAHPQTNGKEERFHRTMAAEVISTRRFKDINDVQLHLDNWRHVYNFDRPHEALGMQTPADRYAASPRSMPATLPEPQYAPGDVVRRVYDGGLIKFKGLEWRVGKALVGQPVALRSTVESETLLGVYFCHQKVAVIDLEQPC